MHGWYGYTTFLYKCGIPFIISYLMYICIVNRFAVKCEGIFLRCGRHSQNIYEYVTKYVVELFSHYRYLFVVCVNMLKVETHLCRWVTQV